MPPELNDLCVSLLRRKPEDRPSGRDVLRILGHGTTGPLKEPLMPTPGVIVYSKCSLRWREQHKRELLDAFNATRQGHSVTIYVHGESGVGKTALVRNFLDDLRANERNVRDTGGPLL